MNTALVSILADRTAKTALGSLVKVETSILRTLLGEFLLQMHGQVLEKSSP